MKAFVKKIFNTAGFEVKRINKNPVSASQRPIGNMQYLLEDLRTRGLHCFYIMDVGANKSYWSRMAKQVYPDADFCLIEPQQEMKQDLENFCREYSGSFFILAGAGANNENKVLTLWEDMLGSSFLPAPHDEHIKNDKQREVEVITINSIIEKNQKIPELIKLDIQGFELEALKGASKTFGITEVFIMEVSLFVFDNNMPVFLDVVNFMNDKDYVVYDFPGFLRRPFDGALGQCDVCFVKKNGFLRSSHQW